MRCECCDKLLSDVEATARFHNEDKDAPIRYVGMCKKCMTFLPESSKILLRSDLENEHYDEEEYIDYEEFNDEEE